jgi:dTDP-glucose pyrophosphorylase
MNVKSFCVRPGTSLKDTLRCIADNGKGIALVVDEDERLLGTVTDGDIRRALLGGAGMDLPTSEFTNHAYVAVGPEASRAHVLDLLQARRLGQMPVVDADGHLVQIHFLHEILGLEERPNWAVIMCGGRGTRLGSITKHIPKPMVSVAGRPILERLVLHLVGYGFRRIFLAVNYLSPIIEEYFGDGSRFGCEIEYVFETEPMDTGGALSLLPEAPSDPVVVMNGDLVTQVDLARMLDFHASEGCEGTIGVRRYLHEIPFGCVNRVGNKLIGIEEKPVVEHLINAGVYVISPNLINRIPARKYPITELFGSAVEEGLPVAAFEIEDEWIDVGHTEQLRKARGGG